MAWTMGALGAWYGLAVVVAVLGLTAERRARGESTAAALRGLVQRLRERARVLAPSVGLGSRERFAAAD